MDTDPVPPQPAETAPRRPRDRWDRRHALTVAAAAFAFALLTAVARLGWQPVSASEAALNATLNGFVSTRPWLVHGLTAVTTLGSAGVLIWMVLLATIVLVVRRRHRLAVFVLVSAAGAPVLDL